MTSPEIAVTRGLFLFRVGPFPLDPIPLPLTDLLPLPKPFDIALWASASEQECGTDDTPLSSFAGDISHGKSTRSLDIRRRSMQSLSSHRQADVRATILHYC